MVCGFRPSEVLRDVLENSASAAWRRSAFWRRTWAPLRLDSVSW